MRIQADPPLNLTYCMNIHPGEGWSDQRLAVDRFARDIARRVCPDRPFGLGLRIAKRAADELRDRDTLERFGDYLDDTGLYVFTVNGFPYGPFHGESVRENVYSPDWRTEQRLSYTQGLAGILAELLPEGQTGSISTVPGAYKPALEGEDDLEAIASNYARFAACAAELMDRTGRKVTLAIEPEPDCLLETADETIDFYSRYLLPAGDDMLVRRHVGVCVDTAHAAVRFERPAEWIARFRDAGVPVFKTQLSAALDLTPNAVNRHRLTEFVDDVYLHQVTVQNERGGTVHYRDLPDALAEPKGGLRWRVHFHVPLFWQPEGPGLGSTVHLLDEELAALLRDGHGGDLEIETYTFDVLPEDLRRGDVVDSVTAEFRWVLDSFLGR